MSFDDWITNDIKSVLLIEPNFPIPHKSRNHKDFLPIGLLKIAGYLEEKSIKVILIRHPSEKYTLEDLINFNPDLICITSIFTYWSEYVINTSSFYKEKFPNIPIIIGGIYASLMPQDCKDKTKCDDVIVGPIETVENAKPHYDLVEVDYQIIHTTRGCIRKCGCCGVYNIEPKWTYKKSIKNEIVKKKIVFYDNNLIANPYIKNILKELIELKKNHRINYVESQSGFDGRILIKKPEIAKLLYDSGFKSPKIAWDNALSDKSNIEQQIEILLNAGYHKKDISIFMIYNYDLDYEDVEKKRVQCFKWGVQITDCRYRPLNSTFDNYSPYKIKGQTKEDYYINPNWSDKQIRKFRRNVRRHNICIRDDSDYHSTLMERKKIPQQEASIYRKLRYEEVKDLLPDAWCPRLFHDVEEQDYYVH